MEILLKSKMNIHQDTIPPFLKESKILAQLPTGGVVLLNEIDSTNQYIIDHISCFQSGYACVTENQIQGRGRRGKIWLTSFGQSICLSIYWKFHQMFSNMIGFGLMVSIVVAGILKNMGASNIQIKWPNDLYVYDRKLAGILIETITANNNIIHIIIGIGINLSMHRTESSILNAKIRRDWINLEDIGIIPDRNMLVAVLINILRQKLKKFECYGLTPFLYYWRGLDYLYNKSVTLSVGDSIKKSGIALGINAYGALIVNQLGVIHSYLRNDVSVNTLNQK